MKCAQCMRSWSPDLHWYETHVLCLTLRFGKVPNRSTNTIKTVGWSHSADEWPSNKSQTETLAPQVHISDCQTNAYCRNMSGDGNRKFRIQCIYWWSCMCLTLSFLPPCQDGWLSNDPFREILLRMTRKPRPHQFIGLMGKRSMGNASFLTADSFYFPLLVCFLHFVFSLYFCPAAAAAANAQITRKSKYSHSLVLLVSWLSHKSQ